MHIDNHHIDAGIAAERVYLCQIAAVIDKVTGFLAVLLHEMVFQHRKTLIHTFTDSDTWHHNDELRPAIAFIQLKHSLDIDVCLTRTRFHLYIERTCPQTVRQTQFR